MSEKLKPCPFCESEAIFSLNPPNGGKYAVLSIDCKKCFAGMESWVLEEKIEERKKEMFIAWNTRVEPIAKVKVNVHPCGISGICTSCGGDVYNVDPYCSHCGAKLDWFNGKDK